MRPFAYLRANDPAQAIAAHAIDAQLAFVAGGTDLLGLMKDRATLPERLLDGSKRCRRAACTSVRWPG